MRKTLLALFMLVPFFGHTQIITTIAGTGTAGFSGDGSAATAAAIDEPNELGMDAAGNIYFSDLVNNRVRKITPAGIISTVAGNGTPGYSGDGGPATAAQLNEPYGLTVDDAGNIYVADENNQRVRKINSSGIISTFAGNGTSGYSGDGVAATATEIWNPSGLCSDHLGNIYISDNQNHRIRKVNAAGIISTVAGTGVGGYNGDGIAATAAQIYFPAGLKVDNSGNLYIADAINYRVRKVNTSGIISTIAGTGTSGSLGDGGAATAAQLDYAQSITIDDSGNIYLSDLFNDRIRKIDTSGIITTIAGIGTAGYNGDGIPAITAKLNMPGGLLTDNLNNIYVSDQNNQRIRKISGPNHPPHFTNGSLQTVTLCEYGGSIDLDTILSVIDTDIAQTETWTVAMAPAHGTLVAAYSTTSTGGVIIPSGLTYTPVSGYSGPDAFKILVNDGIAGDETEVDITTVGPPDAGVISGIDSVCPGHSVTLSETVAGGVWSNSDIAVSTIVFGGITTGIAPGHDTVIYTVINSCGIVSAIFPFTVPADCNTEVHSVQGVADGAVSIFPNPATTELNIVATEKISSVSISNLLGQAVYRNTYTSKQVQINIATLPAGIYLVKVNDAIVRKIVKE